MLMEMDVNEAIFEVCITLTRLHAIDRLWDVAIFLLHKRPDRYYFFLSRMSGADWVKLASLTDKFASVLDGTIIEEV